MFEDEIKLSNVHHQRRKLVFGPVFIIAHIRQSPEGE